MTALYAIITCFSCQNNNMDFKNLDIDLPDNPDKVIENTPGTLYYSNDIKGWYVSSSIPETIDAIDRYLIIEVPDKKFPFQTGKQVLVSGLCYNIPSHVLIDKNMYSLGGIDWYYIKITDLK